MRGLTLIEVLVSFLLLALLTTALLLSYSGLLAGARKSDTNQRAVASLDSLRDYWELRARDNWPATPPPDAPVAYPDGTFNGYIYHVDDYGRVADPTNPGGFLQMKRLRLRLDYKDKDAHGQEIPRTLETLFHVVK